jgi:hypothetical protein
MFYFGALNRMRISTAYYILFTCVRGPRQCLIIYSQNMQQAFRAMKAIILQKENLLYMYICDLTQRDITTKSKICMKFRENRYSCVSSYVCWSSRHIESITKSYLFLRNKLNLSKNFHSTIKLVIAPNQTWKLECYKIIEFRKKTHFRIGRVTILSD